MSNNALTCARIMAVIDQHRLDQGRSITWLAQQTGIPVSRLYRRRHIPDGLMTTEVWELAYALGTRPSEIIREATS